MTNSSSHNMTGRILIVDDNVDGLSARRSVLEELGHKVVTCGTAHDALDLCAKQRFDVVVTDYRMPKMNGLEFIARLKKQHPNVAVILISGFTDTLGLTESGTGADVVMQKSAHEVSQLIRSVSRLLRQQKPPRKPPAPQPPKTEKRKSR